MSKSTQHALKNIFVKTIFLYCHPCLRISSKEISIKKGEKANLVP